MGEDLLYYSNKIQPASFKNVHMIINLLTKRILISITLKTFLRVLPTRWRQKPAGVDTERNNVTVILCIPPLMSETTIHIPDRGRVQRRGRDLGLRRCSRVAVGRKFNTDWSCGNAEITTRRQIQGRRSCVFFWVRTHPLFEMNCLLLRLHPTWHWQKSNIIHVKHWERTVA